MTNESRAKLRAGWARRRALGLPGSRTGIRHSKETKARISEVTRERTARGADHYAWRGGVTPERRRGRKVPGYKAWRRTVIERVGGYCEACQCDRGRGRMQAHHLRGYASAPALATDPDNGAWLCADCHREVHST